MQYVYYCPNCNNTEGYGEKESKQRCSKCGKTLVPLCINMDTWNNLTKEEMDENINWTMNSLVKKPTLEAKSISKSNDSQKPKFEFENIKKNKKILYIGGGILAAALIVLLVILLINRSVSLPGEWKSVDIYHYDYGKGKNVYSSIEKDEYDGRAQLNNMIIKFTKDGQFAASFENESIDGLWEEIPTLKEGEDKAFVLKNRDNDDSTSIRVFTLKKDKRRLYIYLTNFMGIQDDDMAIVFEKD